MEESWRINTPLISLFSPYLSGLPIMQLIDGRAFKAEFRVDKGGEGILQGQSECIQQKNKQ